MIYIHYILNYIYNINIYSRYPRIYLYYRKLYPIIAYCIPLRPITGGAGHHLHRAPVQSPAERESKPSPLGRSKRCWKWWTRVPLKVVNLLGLNGTYNYCGLCSKPFCRMRLARFQPASISWDGIQLWPKKTVITGEQKPHLSDMFHQLQELTRPMAITVDGYNCGRCFDLIFFRTI